MNRVGKKVFIGLDVLELLFIFVFIGGLLLRDIWRDPQGRLLIFAAVVLIPAIIALRRRQD